VSFIESSEADSSLIARQEPGSSHIKNNGSEPLHNGSKINFRVKQPMPSSVLEDGLLDTRFLSTDNQQTINTVLRNDMAHINLQYSADSDTESARYMLHRNGFDPLKISPEGKDESQRYMHTLESEDEDDL